MWTGFSMVRILRPLRSSGAFTGRLLLVMCRKPFSPQASACDALGRELAEHVLADRAVEHRARMRVVAHQERDVEDRDLGHEVRHRTGRGHREVERADLQGFDRLALGAERAGVEILDLVAAAGARLDLARERVDGDAVVRVLADGDVHLQRGLRDGRRGGQRQRGGAGQGERGKEAGYPHGGLRFRLGRRSAFRQRRPERGF